MKDISRLVLILIIFLLFMILFCNCEIEKEKKWVEKYEIDQKKIIQTRIRVIYSIKSMYDMYICSYG